MRENNIALLLNAEIPYTNITVSMSENTYSLMIIVDGLDHITHFGNYVVAARKAFELEIDESERDSFGVTLRDANEDAIITFFSKPSFHAEDAGDYGLIIDNRSKRLKHIALDDELDLVGVFPATAEYLSKSKLNPDRVTTYDEVCKVLDEQYWRSEDEIFDELAPNYGMTAEELRSFMLEMMADIY